MSAIYKDGYWYPADSLNTLKAVTMSNEDYEALTPQEKEELGGIEIFIPDRPLTEGGTGAVIIYNGVEYAGTPTSRLETLEEIVGDGQQSVGSDLTDAVTQLNSSKSNLLTVDTILQTVGAVTAGSIKDFTIDVAKSGYTPLGVIGFNIGAGGGCGMVSIRSGGSNTVSVRIRNNGTSTSSDNTDCRVYILYLKNND